MLSKCPLTGIHSPHFLRPFSTATDHFAEPAGQCGPVVCVTQLSGAEPEPETDQPASSRMGSELTEAAAPSSPAPVLGESFCQCAWADELNAGFGTGDDCLCGEDDDGEPDDNAGVPAHIAAGPTARS